MYVIVDRADAIRSLMLTITLRTILERLWSTPEKAPASEARVIIIIAGSDMQRSN